MKLVLVSTTQRDCLKLLTRELLELVNLLNISNTLQQLIINQILTTDQSTAPILQVAPGILFRSIKVQHILFPYLRVDRLMSLQMHR